MAKAREIDGLDGAMPFAQAAARTVAVRTAEVFDAAGGVLDTQDIDPVHDMRVATRRLRAVLEVYAPCFPRREHRAALRDVKDLADALGARRDADVRLESVAALRKHVTPAEAPQLERLAASLRSEQASGNLTLAAALVRATATDLHGRLLSLADGVRV